MLVDVFNDLNRFFEPWNDLRRLYGPLLTSEPEAEFPLVNVWANEDEAQVTTELAGVRPGDINVSVHGKYLTIRGCRRLPEIKDRVSCYRRERWAGDFLKTIELPFNIEPNKVRARFSEGILHIYLPRAESEKPRKIEIRS